MTPADRQRASRARRRAGRRIVPVEIDEASVAVALVDAKLLTPVDEDNQEKFAAALARLIELVCTADLPNGVSRVTPPVAGEG